jgi:predicted transcriptional regulator
MTVCKKSDIEYVIRTLPEQTSIEEAMERLYLLSKIEKGLRQADRGQIISSKEVEKRLKKWVD